MYKRSVISTISNWKISSPLFFVVCYKMAKLHKLMSDGQFEATAAEVKLEKTQIQELNVTCDNNHKKDTPQRRYTPYLHRRQPRSSFSRAANRVCKMEVAACTWQRRVTFDTKRVRGNVCFHFHFCLPSGFNGNGGGGGGWGVWRGGAGWPARPHAGV